MTRVATASEAITTVSEIAAAAAAALEQGLEDSSESETDNNDETGTTDKFLLLIGRYLREILASLRLLTYFYVPTV